VESYLRENETQIMVSNSILLIMERKLYGSYLASQPIVSLCLPFLLLWSIAWKNCSKIFCVFFFFWKFHLVDENTICSPFKNGGFGVRKLGTFN
jgi:hypothetical protein